MRCIAVWFGSDTFESAHCWLAVVFQRIHIDYRPKCHINLSNQNVNTNWPFSLSHTHFVNPRVKTVSFFLYHISCEMPISVQRNGSKYVCKWDEIGKFNRAFDRLKIETAGQLVTIAHYVTQESGSCLRVFIVVSFYSSMVLHLVTA